MEENETKSAKDFIKSIIISIGVGVLSKITIEFLTSQTFTDAVLYALGNYKFLIPLALSAIAASVSAIKFSQRSK